MLCWAIKQKNSLQEKVSYTVPKCTPLGWLQSFLARWVFSQQYQFCHCLCLCVLGFQTSGSPLLAFPTKKAKQILLTSDTTTMCHIVTWWKQPVQKLYALQQSYTSKNFFNRINAEIHQVFLKCMSTDFIICSILGTFISRNLTAN